MASSIFQSCDASLNTARSSVMWVGDRFSIDETVLTSYEPCDDQLHALQGVVRKRRLLQVPWVDPHIGELLQIAAGLENVNWEGCVDQIQIALEQLLSHALHPFRDGLLLNLEQFIIIARETPLIVCVLVQDSSNLAGRSDASGFE